MAGLHPETGVAAQKRLASSCGLLVTGVNRDEDVQIWIALASQTLQSDWESHLPSIDRYTDCDERTTQRQMSCRIRVAHTSAK